MEGGGIALHHENNETIFATEPSMAACEMFIAGNWISSIEYITCLTLVTCAQNLSRNSKMKHVIRECY